MNEILTIKITGLNLTRFINRMILDGLMLADVRYKHKCIVFNLRSEDIEKLQKICKVERKECIILNKNNFFNVFKTLPNYLGLLLSIVIISCYMFTSNNFIKKINIVNESNINFDCNELVEFLNNLGVESGCDKKCISSERIKTEILTKFSNLSNCNVVLDGHNLNITIIPLNEKYIIDDSNICSKYDAIITTLDVYAGKTNLKVGDIVKTGDLLIENIDGADGKIEGRVNFSSSILYNKNKESVVYTGNYESFKTLSFFNKILYKNKNCCRFSNYLTKKCEFYLTSNFLIPILCEELFCFEVFIKKEVIEFETVEDEIKDDLLIETLKKIPINSLVTNTSYSIVEEGDFTRVDCFVEAIVDLNAQN